MKNYTFCEIFHHNKGSPRESQININGTIILTKDG